MNDVENLITLGKVGSVYGIKGWLKIHSFTENPADIFDYSPWSLKLGGKTQSVTVTDWRKHNNGLIAKFDGIDDRDIAQGVVMDFDMCNIIFVVVQPRRHHVRGTTNCQGVC